MNNSTNAAYNRSANIYCRGGDIAEEEKDMTMEPSRPRFDGEDRMSGIGYERDEEQSASSRERATGKRKSEEEMPIAHKRRITVSRGAGHARAFANSYTDSGYDQDISSDVAVAGNGNVTGADSNFGREEETQIIPPYIQQYEESERKPAPVMKRYSLGKYIDHSLDPDDDRPFAPIHRKPNFPESLMAILSNPELTSIIEWLPHGRSFIILDREEFAKSVLPVYFRHSNLPSFTRQLNGYGFNKIKIGPYEKSYYHPLFLRNLPHLTKSIRRTGTEKSREGQSILSESQLERVSAERPLPEKMNPAYEKHIKTMNQHAYEGYGVVKLREQEVEDPEPAAAAPAPVEAAVPSVIYTPSPKPLPTVVYTPPVQQPSPASGQQGTVFTQTHLPLTGQAPGSAPQAALSPIQEQSQLFPYIQQQPINAPASSTTQEMLGVANQYTAAQSAQAQVTAMADEARRNAQIQLLVNAMSAAASNGQVFVPLTIPVPGILPQLANAQPSPAPQLNVTIPQQQNASYGTSPVQTRPPMDFQQYQQPQQQQQMQVQSNLDASQLSASIQQAAEPVFTFGTSPLINQAQAGLNPELDSLQQYQAAINAQQQQNQVLPMTQQDQVGQTFSILDPSQLVSQSFRSSFQQQSGPSVQTLPAGYQYQYNQEGGANENGQNTREM